MRMSGCSEARKDSLVDKLKLRSISWSNGKSVLLDAGMNVTWQIWGPRVPPRGGQAVGKSGEQRGRRQRPKRSWISVGPTIQYNRVPGSHPRHFGQAYAERYPSSPMNRSQLFSNPLPHPILVALRYPLAMVEPR